MLFSISKLYETETCNRQTVRNYVETRPPCIHVCFESRVMRVLGRKALETMDQRVGMDEKKFIR